MSLGVDSSMAANVPKDCPLCAEKRTKSAVRIYQLNLEEAIALCENSLCTFPMMSGGIIIPNQLSGPKGPLFNGKLLNSPKRQDQDQAAVPFSTSWTETVPLSVPSSITSASHNLTTTSYNWHSTISTPVYHPTPVASKPSAGFNWLSPPSSTQTSPALSVISASDKEVEHVLKSQNCSTFDRLTPSPSPLPKETINERTQQTDDIDSFLNHVTSELTHENTTSPNDFAQDFPDFFGPEQTTQSCDPLDVSSNLNSVLSTTSPALCTVADADILTVNEIDDMCEQVLSGDEKANAGNNANVNPVLMRGASVLKTAQSLPMEERSSNGGPQPSVKPARVIRLAKVQRLPDGVRPILLPGVLNINSAAATRTNAVNIVTSQTQAPTKRAVTLTRVDSAKKIRLSSPATDAGITTAKDVASVSSPGPSSERARAVKKRVAESPKPNVALNIAADGTPVFTVQPVVPSPTASKVTKVKTAPSTPRPRGRPPSSKKTAGTPKPPETLPKKARAKRKDDDAFVINNIVSKFIQRVNNKKTVAGTK